MRSEALLGRLEERVPAILWLQSLQASNVFVPAFAPPESSDKVVERHGFIRHEGAELPSSCALVSDVAHDLMSSVLQAQHEAWDAPVRARTVPGCHMHHLGRIDVMPPSP